MSGLRDQNQTEDKKRQLLQTRKRTNQTHRKGGEDFAATNTV
jgi:hypothetical protein